MWIRTTDCKESVHLTKPLFCSYIEGEDVEEFYFDEKMAEALENDGFLTEMWDNFNAMFDWGDCDFFPAEKCVMLKGWIEKRMSKPTNDDLKEFYTVLLQYSERAIQNDTGISFDF